jgi:dolichyl-phosphate-mannose-protein mannosyltransferase
VAAGLTWAWTRGSSPSRRRHLGTVLAAFACVPVAVYLASYSIFFLQHGAALGDFVLLQARMLTHNLSYSELPPGRSSPVTWPLLIRPVRYFPQPGTVPAVGETRRIVAVGNPVLWWGFLAALPVLGWRLWRRPRWQDVLVVGTYSALYLPWFLPARAEFAFYMLPAVPLMALGVMAALRTLPRPVLVPASVAVACSAAAVAVALLPIWLGLAGGRIL